MPRAHPLHQHLLPALFVFFCVAPLLWSLGHALAYSLGLAGLLSDGLTVAHWAKVPATAELPGSVALSASVALATTGLAVALALAAVLILPDQLRPGGPLSILLHLPLALPPAAAALLILQAGSGAGVLSRLGHAIGLVPRPEDFPELVRDPFYLGVIAAQLIAAVPFFILLFRQSHDTTRLREFLHLAATLGATPWQAVRRVAAPLLLRENFPAITLHALLVFGAFEIPYLIGRQSPQMISVLIRRKSGLYNLAEKPEAFVLAILHTLLASLILAFLLRPKREAV